MVIHYSPFFNSHSHLDVEQRGKAMLGTKVCGTMQLLTELELRCGIVAPTQSEHERMVSYKKAMEPIANDTVFNQSFEVDPIGTAHQVMVWCDALAMEGWTPETPCGDSKKLASLALIAKGVKIKGMAQRWNDVLTYVNEHNILAESDTIEVHAPSEVIPAVVLRVLEKLKAQFTHKSHEVKVENDLSRALHVLQGGEAEKLQHDGSLDIKRFKYRATACQWYLLNIDKFTDSVTVCSDTALVNDLAHAIGCQQVNSTSTKSNPQTLQLFKLGLSLFTRPLNVNNLLSYLRVPGHPAGGVTSKLAKVLVDEGGIDEKWHQVLKDFDFTDEEGNDQRQERMKFLELITTNHKDGIIITNEVRKYANNMAHWADKLMRSDHVNDQRKEQLVVLAAYCRALSDALPNNDTIDANELQKLVNGIYQPHSFTHSRATKGSAETIASPMQLVDPTKSLCWLGCVGNELSLYPFEFVNATEYDHLEAQGVKLPNRADYYALQQQMMVDALSRVSNQLTLITWDYDGNTAVEQHPVVTQLATAFKEKGWQTDTPQLPTAEVNIKELEPQPSYEVGKLLQGCHRERESYSSIDKLIQHPFDYVLNYYARLREPGDTQMADIDITKGNVAHLVVEQLVNDYIEKDDSSFSLPIDLDSRICDAIGQKGAILQLPENKMECTNFVAKLKESLITLADIINCQGLRPVGSEVVMHVDLKDEKDEQHEIGPFEAKIDLLLKDGQDNYVIFDLKWTLSDRHKESLENNTSLQLELYRQAVKVHYDLNYNPRAAYYLLPQCKLVTADSFKAHSAIQQVKVDAERSLHELYEEIKNSYEFRRKELNNGHIEESELMPIANTEYAQQQGLVPLKGQYKQEDKKGVPYVSKPKKDNKSWEDNRSDDPKTIATTHPILKNRLK